MIEQLHQDDLVHDDREVDPVEDHDALLVVANLVGGRSGSSWSRLVKTRVESIEQNAGENGAQEFSKVNDPVHQEEHVVNVLVYADLGEELTVKHIHTFFTASSVSEGLSLGRVTTNSGKFKNSLNSDCYCTIITRMGDLFELFATGPRSQVHMIAGKPVSIVYGDANAVEQALEYGEQVLRLPASWLTLNTTWRPLLHLSKSDVLGANWPFMKFGVESSTLVLPFDEVKEDVLQPLVLIIPMQFVAPYIAQTVTNFTTEIRRLGGFTNIKFYNNAVHVTFVEAGKQEIVGFCTEFRELRIPACLVLASQSAVASCSAAQ